MSRLQQELKLLGKDWDEALAHAAVIRNELEKLPVQLGTDSVYY